MRPGINAPTGCGSPLAWDAEIGPWSGGYNARCDAADFDADGDIDLIVNYPYGGGAVNTMWGMYFYENSGQTSMSGVPIFYAPQRLGFYGDPFVCDWDNDGSPELLTDKVLYKSVGGQFIKSGAIPSIPSGLKCVVDWNGDSIPDLLCSDRLSPDFWPPSSIWKKDEPPFNADGIWKGGAIRSGIRLYQGFINGKGQPGWKDRGLLTTGEHPLEVYGGPDPTVADWDNDGDYDLLTGSQTELVYFENTGSAKKPILRRVGLVRIGQNYDLSGIFLRPVAIRLKKNRLPDIFLAQESGDVTLLRFKQLDERGIPCFESEQKLFQHNTFLDAGCLSVLSIADWDGDEDMDILSGNSYGEVYYFENSGNVNVPEFCSRKCLTAAGIPILVKGGSNGSIQGPGEAHFGYTCPVVCDWNRDGNPDLILSDIRGKYTYYERMSNRGDLHAGVPVRVGEGRIESYKPKWIWWRPQDDELVTQWRCQPAVTDWNKDGTLDLITLDSQGYLALFTGIGVEKTPVVQPPQRVFLLLNGSPIRITPGVGGRSGRARIVIADWDGDGDRDIIRGCTHAGDHEERHFTEFERVAVWYENTGNDSNFLFRGSILKKDDDISFCGHATSPAILDWDGDGQLDILLGTEDGLIYFFSRAYLDGTMK